jgi:hypothetical protein
MTMQTDIWGAAEPNVKFLLVTLTVQVFLGNLWYKKGRVLFWAS